MNRSWPNAPARSGSPERMPESRSLPVAQSLRAKPARLYDCFRPAAIPAKSARKRKLPPARSLCAISPTISAGSSAIHQRHTIPIRCGRGGILRAQSVRLLPTGLTPTGPCAYPCRVSPKLLLHETDHAYARTARSNRPADRLPVARTPRAGRGDLERLLHPDNAPHLRQQSTVARRQRKETSLDAAKTTRAAILLLHSSLRRSAQTLPAKTNRRSAKADHELRPSF